MSTPTDSMLDDLLHRQPDPDDDLEFPDGYEADLYEDDDDG